MLSLLTIKVGGGVTKTVPVSVAVPQPVVYVTVYVVVVAGETVIPCVVPAPGAQLYVPPTGIPFAFRVALLPWQIDAPVNATVGSGVTLTSPELVTTRQPGME